MRAPAGEPGRGAQPGARGGHVVRPSTRAVEHGKILAWAITCRARAEPGRRRSRPSSIGAAVLLSRRSVSGRHADLARTAAHHAARVLRLTVGDPLSCSTARAASRTRRSARSGKDHVAVRIGRWRAREAEPPVRVTLVQGLSTRERMDFTLQKAVELGVAEIFPAEMRRSVMRLAEERAARRVEHWQNLVMAACEQCGRNRVPVGAPGVRAARLARRSPGAGG